MERENVIMDLVAWYVDDYRVFMPTINEGWYWEGGKFNFSWERRKEDEEGGKSGEMRKTEEIVKAMCSLVPFLEFTGESAEMFEHQRLPTLDVDLWWDGEKVSHSFYEKPQVPNRALLKGTALPDSTVRASLVQEVVRRMQNCGEMVELGERERVLSTFAQKLINSGPTVKSSEIIIVQGVTKYLDNRRRHNLPKKTGI